MFPLVIPILQLTLLLITDTRLYIHSSYQVNGRVFRLEQV